MEISDKVGVSAVAGGGVVTGVTTGVLTSVTAGTSLSEDKKKTTQ